MIRRGIYNRGTTLSVFAIICFMAVGIPAWAQDVDQEADQEGSAELQKVAVTGSRIKRTELEGPAPVYIINQEQMSQRGYQTVYEALDALTVNNGLMFEGPESALFTPDVQTINLRGFGVGTTLTLVNGRRLTNYPAAYQSNASVFSFGALPVTAVERIEILATGASAIYGSDAVAGVVNVILRQDINETVVNALWGTPTETKSFSDGSTARVQLLNGKTFERGNYTLGLEFIDRASLLSGHYDEYDDQTDYPFQNTAIASLRGIPDRQIFYADQFRSAFGIAPWYIDPRDNGGCPAGEPLTVEFRNPHGYYCGHSDTGDVNFRNERQSYSLYGNVNYEATDRTTLFADLLYYSSESESFVGDLTVFEDILDLTTPDSVDFGFFDWRVSQRSYTREGLGMNLNETFDDDALTLSLGARGTFSDYTEWELSYTYSTYEYDSTRPWFMWREVIDTMLGTYLGTSFFGAQWWSGGTLGEGLAFPLAGAGTFADISDAVRNAIGSQNYGNESNDDFLQYTMTGDLWELNAGPVQYALVAEYEDQDIQYTPDGLISQLPPTTDINGDFIDNPLVGSGWYKLTGYRGGGDRQRWALGGELRVPLAETLTVSFAGRYDDYDGTSTSFGGDFTPSATIEWRPNAELLIRGGYTESFRAPDLALVYVDTGFFQSAFDLVSCWEQYNFAQQQQGNPTLTPQAWESMGLDGDCDVGSFFATRTGAQNLDPDEQPLDAETGNSYWFGFSWEIIDNLTLMVDYTHLELEDRVIQPIVNDILGDEWECLQGNLPQAECDANARRVERGTDPTTGLSFIDAIYSTPYNSSFLEANSLDVRAYYSLNTDWGVWDFYGEYTHLISLDEQETPESPVVNIRDDPRAGGWDFRSKFLGTISFSRGDFSTTATMNYVGGTTTWGRTSVIDGADYWGAGVGDVTGQERDPRVDSWTTWNWTANYNWTDSFNTRIRVVNVFDERPPLDDTMDGFTDPWFNYFVYSGGQIGRELFLEMQYSFE